MSILHYNLKEFPRYYSIVIVQYWSIVIIFKVHQCPFVTIETVLHFIVWSAWKGSKKRWHSDNHPRVLLSPFQGRHSSSLHSSFIPAVFIPVSYRQSSFQFHSSSLHSSSIPAVFIQAVFIPVPFQFHSSSLYSSSLHSSSIPVSFQQSFLFVWGRQFFIPVLNFTVHFSLCFTGLVT